MLRRQFHRNIQQQMDFYKWRSNKMAITARKYIPLKCLWSDLVFRDRSHVFGTISDCELIKRQFFPSYIILQIADAVN